MWIAISVVLGIISLISIFENMSKSNTIKSLAYENAYLFILMHEKEDKSIKDINDMAKSAIERQRFIK
ncbi:DUF1514 family protein [Staphylococcus epidermidis]|jgi:hypothetical protein|uniref:DUF1514 domain-containing protein n=1 Tax=Staphylococcus phage HS13 TaxID=3056403 RepID=A0AA49X2U5_9VIRU|nr:DUF1514 family protein [Staphylococcus epidermidis]UVD33301.1 DUF1514 family protein [Staphylococcus phage Lacachita]WLJ26058.1 MAG: protein of unknown function (DUF1514) [Staphylococcus phage HS13]WNM55307.1 hypothetical protein CoNPh27_CDS0041 [Staphylococcus phage S-CoN_Ph27]DAI53248.1 MAG TPA: Protein of unknown function (DUF1514) [Caudoviricetes sp.]MDU2779138.1 DUF1514 family protein [Staphylococcus epidermidis]